MGTPLSKGLSQWLRLQALKYLACWVAKCSKVGFMSRLWRSVLHTLGTAPLSAKSLHLWQGWKTDGLVWFWKALAALKGTYIKPQQPSSTFIMGDAFFGLSA